MKGTPKSVVIIPMGISAGAAILLAIASDKTTIIPPKSEDIKIRLLVVFSPKTLAICGTINPTKAMGPVKETVRAIIVDVKRKKINFKLFTLTPFDTAISSDREKRSNSFV